MNFKKNKLNIALFLSVGGIIFINPPMLYYTESENFESSAKIFYSNIKDFNNTSIKKNIEKINYEDRFSFGYEISKHVYNKNIIYNNINGYPIGNNSSGNIEDYKDCIYLWNTFSDENEYNIVYIDYVEKIKYEKNTLYVEYYNQTCEFQYNGTNIKPMKKIIYDARNSSIKFKNFFNKGEKNV